MIDKKKLIIVPILLLIAVIVVIFKSVPEGKFELEDKYYGKGQFTEINQDDLNKLINDQESFALFIYQPACVTSSNFEKVLNDFIESNNIEVYKIAFSDIKGTDLNDTVKYYPSFALYNKGKLIDALDANSDKDEKYYKSKEDFSAWFTNYVILKEVENNLNEESANSNDESDNSNDDSLAHSENNTLSNEENVEEISLDNVIKEENKVNIYFFWGSTCPHCKEEFAFFDEIKEEYGNYYNLYTYEVWENPDNAEIMNKFADALNEEPTVVPYTIIGDESFTGFSESSKDDFIKAIESKHQNSNDIYFDKIKSKE